MSDRHLSRGLGLSEHSLQFSRCLISISIRELRCFLKKRYGLTDGHTDERTYGRTDERTDPLIEIRGRIYKRNASQIAKFNSMRLND